MGIKVRYPGGAHVKGLPLNCSELVLKIQCVVVVSSYWSFYGQKGGIFRGSDLATETIWTKNFFATCR